MNVFHTCLLCDEVIVDPRYSQECVFLSPLGEKEGYVHVVCRVRAELGGVNCLLKQCACHGGPHPKDPPGTTRYQAAVLAAALWSTLDP